MTTVEQTVAWTREQVRAVRERRCGVADRQLECRAVITEREDGTFSMGMYDPVSGRYVPLGQHHNRDRQRIIGDLKRRIEAAGHLLTMSVVSGRR